MTPTLQKAFFEIVFTYMDKQFEQARNSSDKILKQHGGVIDGVFFQSSAYSSYWLGERERFNQVAQLYAEKIGDPRAIMYWEEPRPVLARLIENAMYTPYTSKTALLLEASFPIFIDDLSQKKFGRVILGSLNINEWEQKSQKWFEMFNAFFDKLRSQEKSDDYEKVFVQFLAGNLFNSLPETQHGKVFQFNFFQAIGNKERFEILKNQIESLYEIRLPEFREEWIFNNQYENLTQKKHKAFEYTHNETTLQIDVTHAELSNDEWFEIIDLLKKANYIKMKTQLDLNGVHFISLPVAKKLGNFLNGVDCQCVANQPMLVHALTLAQIYG